MKDLIVLENISKVYGKGDNAVHALRSVYLRIREGEFLSIMGPSGCGKTTLLNIIGCMDRPSEGRYTLDGQPVNDLSDNKRSQIRANQTSFIFQSFALMEGYSVYDNLLLPLLKQKISKAEQLQRMTQALDQLGLKGLLKRNVSKLSGGQKQRVAIARSLVSRSSIILADEPTGALDSTNGKAIMEIFKELNTAGKTIILVTHDENWGSYASRHCYMLDGKIDSFSE